VDRPDPTDSGGGQGPARIAVGRALAVIVVAVVLGVLIVHSWGSPGSAAIPPPTSGTTTSTTSATTLPPTTTTTTPRGDVKVLVANGSTTNGIATGYTTALQRAGWNMLVPTNAKPPPRATSAVYYAANKRDQADVVAQALGLPLSDVFPISPATPVTSTTGADVVVVIGSDLAAKTPPSTVPPTTTTTAAHTTTTR
jgi:hypothetical protein